MPLTFANFVVWFYIIVRVYSMPGVILQVRSPVCAGQTADYLA
jgi:hypothetical protein